MPPPRQDARLFTIVQLVISGLELSSQQMAPPFSVAEFPVIVQLITLGLEPLQ
jgi:hypothetical protein